MPTRTFTSGRLRAADYDPDSRQLDLHWSDKTVTAYRHVPQEVFRRLCAAPNPATYWEDRIAEEYPKGTPRSRPAGAAPAADLAALFGGTPPAPSQEPPMTPRELGRSGLRVSPIAFGGNVFGWTADEATSFRLLDAWVDHGFNFIDTADVYSTWVPGHQGGESEALIGKWLRATGKRDRVVIATKVGKPIGGRQGLAPATIRAAVEDSLRRLQTDVIDLYQSHDDDPATPLADTLSAFADLVRAGKVRAIGASNHSAPRLREALETSARLGLPRYESLQPLYNLADRAPYEEALQAVCAEHGIGVIPFYALAAGFLTGKYRSAADAGKSPRGRNVVGKYLNERGLRILAALDAVAARHGATCGQVAVAWLLAQPTVTAPIASATSVAQLDELVAAAALRLAPEDLAALRAASD